MSLEAQEGWGNGFDASSISQDELQALVARQSQIASTSPRGSASSSERAFSVAGSAGSENLALVPAGSDGISVSAMKVAAGFFQCTKCKKTLPLATMCSSRQGVCKPDSASYKNLTTRWAKNRELRNWFTNLSEEGQTAWYLRQQAHVGADGKRKFDAGVHYSDRSEQSSETGDFEVDRLVPWPTFKRLKLQEGMSVQQAEVEFAELVDNPSVECTKARGQWLVPIFEGIERTRGTATRQIQDTCRTATIEDPEALAEMQAQGQLLRRQFLHDATPTQIPLPHAPTVLASEADQPVRNDPRDVMAQQISREVSKYSYSQAKIGSNLDFQVVLQTHFLLNRT